jgi:tetratricopeptide (TPR) repeat protein
VAVQEKAEAQFAGDAEARRELARSHLDAARQLHSAEQIADEEKLCRWAVAHLQKLLDAAPDRTEDRDGLARASLALGNVLRKAGRLGDAEKACRQAVDHFTRPDPSPEHLRALASAYNLLGVILREDNRPGAAEPALEKSADLWTKLVAEFPDQRALRHQEANARNNLGYVLVLSGRPAKAEPHHRKALELFLALAAEDDASSSYRDGLGMSYSGLSAVHAAAGRLDQAEETSRRAVALYRELVKVKAAPWYRLKLGEVANLGLLVSAAGRPADAVPALEEALAIQEKLAAEWPKVPRYPRAVVLSQNNLAWLLATCPDAKVRDPRRAVDLAQRAAESAPKDGGVWNTLGVARYRAGDAKASVEALKKSMELTRGGSPFDWFFLAMATQQLGQAADARQWFDKAATWMDANKERLAKDKLAAEELRRFRAEAEELLDRKSGR